MVCVGPSPTSAKLIRAAKRASVARHVPWIAAFVDSPRLSEGQRRSAAENLRLAEKLGAEVTTVIGPRVSEEIVALARSKNVSTIIIGKPVRPRWKDFLLGSPVDDLVRKSGEIDVHVIRGDAGGEKARLVGAVKPRLTWRPYLAGLGIWGAATAVSFAMDPGDRKPGLEGDAAHHDQRGGPDPKLAGQLGKGLVREAQSQARLFGKGLAQEFLVSQPGKRHAGLGDKMTQRRGELGLGSIEIHEFGNERVAVP